MRPSHEHDCSIHRSPICDCGAFLKASRLGFVPGWQAHCQAIKFADDYEDSQQKMGRQPFQQAQEKVEVQVVSTGTLAGGTVPQYLEIEVMLNGRVLPVRPQEDGSFTLTYGEIAAQLRKWKGLPEPESAPDRPAYTVTYYNLTQGEASGLLSPGQMVPVVPGLVINAVDTGQA